MLDKAKETNHALQNSYPTIAVLVGSMTSEYQEGIMRGAAHVASEKNFNIIGYCGGALNSADPLTLARGKVFDLVDMSLISGVISPFSSHMRFLDKHASKQFINKFSSVPVVNIGSHIEGCTNILTDYETGFKEVFEHLYHEHGRRHILLVRGPEHHASSIKRMDIYKKLLTHYGLPFDEELIMYSNLNRSSTRLKMNSFLDNLNKPFDAIITINDNQALAVSDACRDRGIRIPEDVSLIGSMNTLEGIFAKPSLSSIQEPLFELGRTAAIELIEQIEGKAAQSEILIPTSLIIRKSCGCKSSTHNKGYQIPHQHEVSSLVIKTDPILSETKSYFKKIVEQYKGGVMREEADDLIHLYQHAINQKDFHHFLNVLETKLDSALESEDIILWLTLTAKLQISTLQYIDIGNNAPALLSFIEKLTLLKNTVEQLAIKYQRFETDYYLNYFRAIVKNLNSSFDLITIKKYTIDILRTSELYISLFDELNATTMNATNLAAVRKNKFIDLDERSFDAKRLVPHKIENYHERFTLMVFPLSFRNESLGFLTLNLSNRKGAAFENLRAIISSALKNELLIKELKKAEQRFSDIAHSTSNWLWETDINHRFTYCSDSSKEIIGYSEAQLLNKKINELNLLECDDHINKMLRHEKITDLECWYQHKNGHTICLLISAKKITNDGVFNGYRGIFKDITEKKSQEEKIKNLAYSDSLTGLPNRTLFQDKLAETISFSSLNKKKFALMFIDLDHFKHINDSMGHAAGDQLLIKLATRLNQSIRASDMLCRLGGDEFIIILPDIINEADIIEIAQRIFKNMQAPIMINAKPIYSTLSAGVSLYPNDGIDAQSLLQQGDNAMYQAKSQGRNGYVFYDKLLEEKNNLRNMYEEILRQAIVNEEFVLNYQPQVASQTGNVIGFEALVRIKNSNKPLIAPGHFIPLAEELGLIGQIDEWVFKECCAQYAKWKAQGLKNKRLSINLSARQLRDDSILNTYIRILEKYHVEAADIQLEITENALIENERVALKILQGFKRYGISIALDDFGTGYSSLNCINLYPIDTIKIDRSFVKDAIDNPKNKAIIEGIVLIASSLHLNIIAEGVETEEQYKFITQLGCNEIQGFYFYKPCPYTQAQQLLEHALTPISV